MAKHSNTSLGEIISANLLRLRDHRGWSQQDVADHANPKMYQKTVQRIEKGESDPQASNVDAIAKAFGLYGWQLCVPDLNPEDPPILAPSKSQREVLQQLITSARELGRTS